MGHYVGRQYTRDERVLGAATVSSESHIHDCARVASSCSKSLDSVLDHLSHRSGQNHMLYVTKQDVRFIVLVYNNLASFVLKEIDYDVSLAVE